MVANAMVTPPIFSDRSSSARRLIRRASDVPVLLSAMAAKPDWLLTHNTKRFSRGSRCGVVCGLRLRWSSFRRCRC